MDESSEIPRCIPGDMDLAPAFAAVLRHWVDHPESRESNARGPSPDRFYGDTWFCPACGVPTTEADGHVRCTCCHGPLDGFMWDLIEKHPHKLIERMPPS